MQNYLGYLFCDYSYIGKDLQESRDEGEIIEYQKWLGPWGMGIGKVFLFPFLVFLNNMKHVLWIKLKIEFTVLN